MKLPAKYKVPLTGKYNEAVFICPECNLRLIGFNHGYGDTAENTIGFADSNIGLVAIIECPRCFTKWYFHGDSGMGSHIEHFLERVKEGDNKHFKE